MSSGPSLHSMHGVEQDRPQSRSRVRRVLYFVPLTMLMIAVFVMVIIGLGAR